MALLTIKALPCPACQQPLKPQQLVKQPYHGKLPWYGITPAPAQHCPHCNSALQLTGWHKGWLTLAIINIILVFVTHIYPYRGDLSVIQQILLFIPVLFLILVAATSLIHARNQAHYAIVAPKDTVT
ncbi:hypothetical protein KRX19_04960 [Cardiobacteriaceae bacterium TAE3-ERU3]|nr:hypothetical protein [Cardiobacteriaceae bacterium TAE3-ERU3]